MQFFTGSPALSSFRLDKLLNEIRQRVAAVSCIDSHYTHFADLETLLSAAETGVLEKLLQYGPALQDKRCEGELFLVTPRAGTISPWSSKSTDIAHNCGLGKILRLERGIAYNVGSSSPFSDAERSAIGCVVGARVGEIVERALGHTNNVITDELRAFRGTVIGVLQTAFPFENGPAVEVVLSELGKDAREIDLPVAKRTEATGTIDPTLVTTVDTLATGRIQLGIFDMEHLDTLVIDVDHIHNTATAFFQ